MTLPQAIRHCDERAKARQESSSIRNSVEKVGLEKSQHFLPAEALDNLDLDAQAELQHPGRNGNAKIVIREQKATLAVCGLAAGIEKPRRRPGRVNMEQGEELLFEMPETEQRLLADAKGAEKDEGAKEGEERIGVARALERWQLKPSLQAVEINRRAVQSISHFAECVHFRITSLRQEGARSYQAVTEFSHWQPPEPVRIPPLQFGMEPRAPSKILFISWLRHIQNVPKAV